MTRLLHAHPAIDAELVASVAPAAFRWAGRRGPVEV